MESFSSASAAPMRLILPLIIMWVFTMSHLFAAPNEGPENASPSGQAQPTEAPVATAPAMASTQQGYVTTILDNGLKILVKEMPAAPVVAVNIWIHVGSRNEKTGEEGFSHLIEHMMFKGTASYPVGQLDREIKKLGASSNAFTASDYTCYHVLGARDHFNRLMELQAEAVLNSSFVPDEFQRELAVVLEEMRMDKDDPESLVYNQTKETAYKVHPYRHPIVGYESNLASSTRDQVYGFYKKYYVPGNMAVVIVGDVKASEVIETVKRLMGSAPAAAVPDQTAPVEPPQDGRREARLYGDVQQAYVNLAWHAPGIKNPDNFVMDIITTMMGHGRSSRLYKTLVEEERLASDLSASYFTSGDPSLFIISAQLPQSNIRKFTERAITLMEELKNASIPGEEFDKVKQQLIASTIFGKETAESQASNYGHYITLGFLNEADRYLDRIRDVTLEDLARVAKSTFNDKSLSVVSYEPPLASAAAKPELLTLENGLRLILRENHSSPIVALTIQVDAGGLREGKNEAGLANLTAASLLKGTKKRTASEIAELFESMGTSISCQAQKSYVTLKMQTLSEKFQPSLKLLMEILGEAEFPEEELKKEQEKALEAIKAQEDDLFYYTYYKSLASLFPNSPLGYSNIGTSEHLGKIKRSEVQDFFRKHYCASGMVVSIVGDIFPTETKDRLVNVFSNLDKGSQNPVKDIPALEGKAFPIEVTGKKNREQAQVLVAWRTFPRKDSHGPAMDVLKNILSGSMSSRLFTNLRDRDSLAYSVWATQVGTVNTGYFFATLSTKVGRVDEARTRLIEELEKIRKEGFTDEEFNDAKTYIIGQHALNLVDNQSLAETLGSDEFFGLGYDYFLKYPEAVKAVTQDQVKEVAEQFLLGSNKYIVGITKP